MPPPSHVRLGPRTQVIVSRAVWAASDQFPADQKWADEFEKVLAFLESEGQLGRFTVRLSSRSRDGALEEAWVAFYLSESGFQVIAWEPVAVPNRPGDLEITWPGTEPLFVEVKAPAWEGEISEEARASRRLQPKYINGQGGAVDPIERVMYVVRKALPKFAPHRANLVAIVDDLFVSPVELPRDVLTGCIRRDLEDAQYRSVSGIVLLRPVNYSHRDTIEYRTVFVPGFGRGLPDPARDALSKDNTRSGPT